MLESSRVWQCLCGGVLGAVLAGCVAPAEQLASPAVVLPVAVAPVVAPRNDDARLMEEAKAMLAQAETDVQRARAKRALWSRAWEDLLAARQAVAAKDSTAAVRHARRASEFAQLGLEQLAYPAVK
jgi:hypothetical protein